jgi:LysM repeat protein
MGLKKLKSIYRKAACLGGILIAANAGCSLLSSKEDSSANLTSTKVATNVNELPLPVEINNDIGKIAGGGGQIQSGSFSGGGSGRVNVNVNVNFTGRGWTKTISESKDSGETGPERQPAGGGDVSDGQDLADSINPKVSSDSRSRGSQTPGQKDSGGTKKYVVKPGDTLMKISFESFGNVYRWREILNANKGKIANYSSLTPGLELRINGVNYVVIDRNGQAYLIVRNDTLGKISRKVYGTRSFWHELWKNNPQLIHNPHKIYAGFTLYYRDKSELGTQIRNALETQNLPSIRVPATNFKK